MPVPNRHTAIGVVYAVIQKNDTVKMQNDTVKSENDTVFSLIKQNKNITATEISERLNLSLSTVKRKIKNLKEQGIIERTGSDKTGFWKMKNNNDPLSNG